MAVVNCPTWLLGSTLRSYETAESVFNHQDTPLAGSFSLRSHLLVSLTFCFPLLHYWPPTVFNISFFHLFSFRFPLHVYQIRILMIDFTFSSLSFNAADFPYSSDLHASYFDAIHFS